MTQSFQVSANIEGIVLKARSAAIDAQRRWWRLARRDRFRIVGAIAQRVALHSSELVEANPRPATPAEILTSEVFPLADACKFAVKQGPRLLAPYSHKTLFGAWWMGRIGVSVIPEPWGLVLILAPWNYPLLLAGVQMVQAVAAGNAVLVKPSPDCQRVTALLRDCMEQAGVPSGLVQVLPTDVAAAESAIQLGVDKVFLTGSANTGRNVLHQLADKLTPSTMELSGCDAVFVLPQADLQRAAKSIAFALKMNAGATCIAPRRIFVTQDNHQTLCELLQQELADVGPVTLRPSIQQQALTLVDEAIERGARRVATGRTSYRTSDEERFPITLLADVQPSMRIASADLFAPVASLIQVTDMTQAVPVRCALPYHLGASIFGPEPHATHWAEQVQAGCVTINDVLVPTADPRVSFGGRNQSGWGVTRGPEGYWK